MIPYRKHMVEAMFFGMTDELVFGAVVDTREKEYKSDVNFDGANITNSDGITVAKGATIEGTHVLGIGPYASYITQGFGMRTVRSLDSLFSSLTFVPRESLHGYMEQRACENSKDRFPIVQTGFTPGPNFNNNYLNNGEAQGIVRYQNHKIKPYSFGVKRIHSIDDVARFMETRIIPCGSVSIIGFDGFSLKVYPKPVKK